MAPSSALTSDHVNYLVFRYLQEAGHENSATAFYRDWHRNAEFRDPENLPFAPSVRRNELVSIIQSGLQHDELESRVRKNERRFRLTRLSSGDALGDRQQGGLFENGSASASRAGSRPGSSAKRKGRLSAVRAQGDFPTPAPKRRRRSEEGQTNGDVMDVDAASPSAAEADEDGEAVSPTIASESETVEVPARYDSMDVAVQTEAKSGPKTSTMYWKIDKPGSTIYHSIFNPTVDAGSDNTLLTVGESLCRFYQIPSSLENVQQVLSVDEPTLPLNAVVTASAWHPSGNIVAIASDTIRDLSDGVQASEQALFSHDCTTGLHVQYTSSPTLDPQGIILALRYNTSGDKLLVLRTNLKRGLILVYDTQKADPDQVMPVAWFTYGQQVLDAAWLTENDYVVAGDRGLARIAHIDDKATSEPIDGPLTSENKSHGISHTDITLPEAERERNFDKVRISSPASMTSAVLLASSRQKALLVTQQSQKNDANRPGFSFATQSSERMTAIAFQSLADGASGSESALIAVTSEDGSCVLYAFTPPLDENTSDRPSERFREVARLYLRDGPALALAWSPDGAFLAVAGIDLVQIWDLESFITRERGNIGKKTEGPHKALITWRADTSAVGASNGEHGGAATISEPSLSWSADGQSLALAVDQDVAVIKFRPPLGRTDDAVGINGHTSP